MQVKLPYHIRVLICCYKEDLDCVQRTIECAASALLPYGCTRTIYLCDDRKDPEKQVKAWAAVLLSCCNIRSLYLLFLGFLVAVTDGTPRSRSIATITANPAQCALHLSWDIHQESPITIIKIFAI